MTRSELELADIRGRRSRNEALPPGRDGNSLRSQRRRADAAASKPMPSRESGPDSIVEKTLGSGSVRGSSFRCFWPCPRATRRRRRTGPRLRMSVRRPYHGAGGPPNGLPAHRLATGSDSVGQKVLTDRAPRVRASTVSFVQYGSAYPHRISAPYDPWTFLICSNNGRLPPGNTSPIPVFPRNWES